MAATTVMDFEEEVMPQPAQILLISQPLPITASSLPPAAAVSVTAAAAAAAATAAPPAAASTTTTTTTTNTNVSSVAAAAAVALVTAAPGACITAAPVLTNSSTPAGIIYSQRLPPGRLPHVQPPVLCPETRSRVIIEAIDALRARKARPDETRITHWVNRRYGIQKDDAVSIIHQSVEEGSVIRVKYKDSISYRNPAKFPRSTAQVNLAMRQRQQKQQVNGGESHDAEKDAHAGANASVRVAAACGDHSHADHPHVPADSGPPGAQCPIPAIKKILRAVRTLTTKSADPSVGASVEQIIALIGSQRELGFPLSFVSRVLKAGVSQGTVRRLPSGNYKLMSGWKKKETPEKKNENNGALQPQSAQPTAPTNGSPTKKSNASPQKVLLTASDSDRQKQLIRQRRLNQQPQQQRWDSVPRPGSILTSEAGSAAAAGDCNSQMTINSMSQVPPPPPLMLQQTAQRPLLQAAHQQQQMRQQQPASAAPAMQNSALPQVRRHQQHKKIQHIRKQLLVNRPDHRVSGGSKGSEVGRGRPISQRKKFKKNLGPDFLEPSDLGMPYLQNSFEPKCDYCDRPASRSPRGKHEEFLVCKDCDFKAHPKSCLKYSEELIARCRESEWQCQYCKDCCMCDKSGDVESILFCDACDQGYHMACHNPPLQSKPDGAWICTSCQIRRQNGVPVPKSNNRTGRSEQNTASDDGFEEESEESANAESLDEAEEEFDSQASGPGYGVRIQKQRKDSTDKILSQLQPPIELISEQNPHMPAKPQDWSCDDVETFIRFIGFPDHSATFREQEIDGMSLLLLKRSDLLSGMDLKLGPAVKIYGHVQRLQMMPQQQQPPPHVNADDTNNAQNETQQNGQT